MTVRLAGEVIILEGDCPVEEAEPLLELLSANPGAAVDWSACGQLHTSLVQVLLAIRPPVNGDPENPFLRHWIAALMRNFSSAPT
jgi:hypothetical protein